MTTEKKKTIQIGLRLNAELVKDIDTIAKLMKTNRVSWIKNTLSNQASMELYSKRDSAIDDFINLTLDEEELKSILSTNKISPDIIKARKEVLNKIMSKKEVKHG